jgi:hypothetical protein
MTPRELYLHQRAFGAGYHLRRRGTGYSLLDMYNREELECPDLDALESCVKHELKARRQTQLSAACEGRLAQRPHHSTVRRSPEAEQPINELPPTAARGVVPAGRYTSGCVP